MLFVHSRTWLDENLQAHVGSCMVLILACFTACLIYNRRYVAVPLVVSSQSKTLTTREAEDIKIVQPGTSNYIGTTATAYDTVLPLPNFDWRTTTPLKLRPFKPKYHLTMSINNSNVSELLELDQNYVDRIMVRRQLILEHRSEVVAALPGSQIAVKEFYVWLTGTYLPTRFPRIFQLRINPVSQVTELFNDATGDFTSLTPCNDTESTLSVLGGLVEDDLLFLLPVEDSDSYQLKAFITCFPNGFRTREKLGLNIREIHKPVPGYSERLEKSMDRWFNRLEVGTFVKRYNWTITPHDRLFTTTGNHLYEGDVVEQMEVEIEKTRVRSERQVVHRLPQSRAILFSFKTYLYSIQEIKEEGLGEVLAEAIDGLKSGNVPQFYQYKRASEWGSSVQRYLRS